MPRWWRVVGVISGSGLLYFGTWLGEFAATRAALYSQGDQILQLFGKLLVLCWILAALAGTAGTLLTFHRISVSGVEGNISLAIVSVALTTFAIGGLITPFAVYGIAPWTWGDRYIGLLAVPAVLLLAIAIEDAKKDPQRMSRFR